MCERKQKQAHSTFVLSVTFVGSGGCRTGRKAAPAGIGGRCASDFPQTPRALVWQDLRQTFMLAYTEGRDGVGARAAMDTRLDRDRRAGSGHCRPCKWAA